MDIPDVDMKQLVPKLSKTVEHLRTRVATQKNQIISLTNQVTDLKKRVPVQKGLHQQGL